MISRRCRPIFEPQVAGGIVSGSRHFEQSPAGVDFLHRHLILGESARLVRTDRCRAAERFHGGQVPNDGAPGGHARHADGKCDRDHGGKSLRDRADRECDRRHEDFDEPFPAPDFYQNNNAGEAKDQPQQQPAKLGHFACKRRVEIDGLGYQPCDAPGLRPVSGRPDHALAIPGCHQCPGKGQIGAVRQHGVLRNRTRMLGDGKGLSGESGLIHPQLAHGGQAQVSRNTVSRIEENDVSRNELIGGDTTPFPITTHCRIAAGQSREGIDRLLCFAFLEEAHDRIHHDDAENYR